MTLTLNKQQQKKDILLLSCEWDKQARYYMVQEWLVGWNLFPRQ
jgi:hypothetical protein